MQEQAWDQLLRRIPIELHDGLVLATVTGAEVILQSLVRIDANFLIMRGRTAGTSDNGRLIILPLDKINYVGVPAKLSDQQIKAMFSGDAPSAAGADEWDDDEYVEDTDGEIHEEESTDDQYDEDIETEDEEEAAQSRQSSKAMLLAKLRARLAGDNSNSSR